jgi:DNA-binding YbaB/EbfC family protein
MIGDLLLKLHEAKQKIEEAKKKLNNIIVESSVDSGAIRVKANANKAIISIEIAGHLIQPDNKTQLEEMLTVAVNKALEEAAAKGEIEMKKVTQDMLPNFPGLV